MDNSVKTIKHLNWLMVAMLGILFGHVVIQFVLYSFTNLEKTTIYIIADSFYVLSFILLYKNNHQDVFASNSKNDMALVLPGIAFMYGLSFFSSIIVLLVETGLNYCGIGMMRPEIVFSENFLPNFILAVETCFIAPLIEETFFRGILLNNLKEYGKFSAIVYTSLWFGIFHGNLAQALPAFLIGVVFAIIDLKAQSIRPSIMLHAFNNTVSLIILYTNNDSLMMFFSMGIIASAVYVVKYIHQNYSEIKANIKEAKIWPFFKNKAAIIALAIVVVEMALTFYKI